MSFINSLLQQQRSTIPAPSVAQPVNVTTAPMDGLAGTFREPNRFNAPINRQFGVDTPLATRHPLERNYRG